MNFYNNDRYKNSGEKDDPEKIKKALEELKPHLIPRGGGGYNPLALPSIKIAEEYIRLNKHAMETIGLNKKGVILGYKNYAIYFYFLLDPKKSPFPKSTYSLTVGKKDCNAKISPRLFLEHHNIYRIAMENDRLKPELRRINEEDDRYYYAKINKK